MKRRINDSNYEFHNTTHLKEKTYKMVHPKKASLICAIFETALIFICISSLLLLGSAFAYAVIVALLFKFVILNDNVTLYVMQYIDKQLTKFISQQ